MSDIISLACISTAKNTTSITNKLNFFSKKYQVCQNETKSYKKKGLVQKLGNFVRCWRQMGYICLLKHKHKI